MTTAGNDCGSAPVFCDCGQRGVQSQLVMQHRITRVIAYDIWNCKHCIILSCFSIRHIRSFFPFHLQQIASSSKPRIGHVGLHLQIGSRNLSSPREPLLG